MVCIDGAMFIFSPLDPDMLIMTLFSYCCQARILDLPTLPELLMCPMFPPAARVYDIILLDSLVLRKPSLVSERSFLVKTPRRYGSFTNLLAEYRAAGFTTSIFWAKRRASALARKSSGRSDWSGNVY